MKKFFISMFLLIGVNTFATVVHFTSSCGKAATVTTNSSWGSAQMTQELIDINYEMCGTRNVRIIYS